jgi:hypothetical protein
MKILLQRVYLDVVFYLPQAQKLQNFPALRVHGIDTESSKIYSNQNQHSGIKNKYKNHRNTINDIPTDPDNEQELGFWVNIKPSLKFGLTLQLNQLHLLIKIFRETILANRIPKQRYQALTITMTSYTFSSYSFA